MILKDMFSDKELELHIFVVNQGKMYLELLFNVLLEKSYR